MVASFLWTVCFVPGEQCPVTFFSKFIPLISVSPFMQILSVASSESVRMGFDCNRGKLRSFLVTCCYFHVHVHFSGRTQTQFAVNPASYVLRDLTLQEQNVM